jgi:hypothetical protein
MALLYPPPSSRLGGVGDIFHYQQHLWIWVLAFAGTITFMRFL